MFYSVQKAYVSIQPFLAHSWCLVIDNTPLPASLFCCTALEPRLRNIAFLRQSMSRDLKMPFMCILEPNCVNNYQSIIYIIMSIATGWQLYCSLEFMFSAQDSICFFKPVTSKGNSVFIVDCWMMSEDILCKKWCVAIPFLNAAFYHYCCVCSKKKMNLEVGIHNFKINDSAGLCVYYN